MNDKKIATLQCVDCGMKEREEWALAGNHQCNLVTDYNYLDQPGLYKIGKRRWLKIVANAPTSPTKENS